MTIKIEGSVLSPKSLRLLTYPKFDTIDTKWGKPSSIAQKKLSQPKPEAEREIETEREREAFIIFRHCNLVSI